MLKRILCFSLAMALAVSGLFTGFCYDSIASAAGIDWSELFTITYNERDKQYTTTKKNGWSAALAKQLGSSTELEFPETYNDGTNGEAPISLQASAFVKADTGTDSSGTTVTDTNFPNITSITFSETQDIVPKGMLYKFPNVETVTFKANGVKFLSSIAYAALSNDGDVSTYASKVKTVYINGDDIKGIKPDTFAKINKSIEKVYVTSKELREKILGIVKYDASSNPNGITEDQIEVKLLKQESSIEIACDDIYVNTEGGFKPTVKKIVGDQNAEIEYTLYDDEACAQKSTRGYNSSSLPVGAYYIRALMKSTETYSAAYSNVVPVKVKENEPTNKDVLNAAIEAANTFYEENRFYKANYDEAAWNNVFYRGNFLDAAKEISADTENKYSQEKVDQAAANLNAALDALKKSKADNTEAWNKLQNLIKTAEGIVANDKDKYSEESWTQVNLQSRIDDAKALKKDDATTTVTEIQRHIDRLQSGIDGLKVKPIGPVVTPGNPFAYIPKKGSQVKVLSMTAPESLAGAAKIRVTFKCADDVSFNEHASIDVNATIAGEQIYEQFKGTSNETGASHTVELNLPAAIKAGDSIELLVATFSWDNANDYVYGVTSIEFADASGKVLSSYIDKDVYKENLAAAIKEAEAIDTATYTDDSVKKLTDALDAAKALKEDATAEEMKNAIDAINDAIKGLEKKDDDEEARVKLTAKVKETEAIDTSLYTPESVEKLTKALEAAKALKDDATEEEINKVLADIEAAIKGLVKKDGNSNGAGNDNPQQLNPTAKVIGVAKGKTFNAGSIKFKVSVAATMTGTVKTAGKVTVVGLSSKKKTSVNVKNTVSASGASYQVTGIASKAFKKAAKLKNATLGSNIKSIPTSAFESCKKLSAVKATGVTKIGKKAFKGCKTLKKLTFGKKKLSSVKKGAFKGCKKTIKVAGGSKKVKKGNVKKLKKSGYKKFK